MADHAEGEVVADDIGAGHENQQTGQRDQDAVDHQPAPVLVQIVLEGGPENGHSGLSVDVGRVHGGRGRLPAQMPQQPLLGDTFGHGPHGAVLRALEPAVLVGIAVAIAFDAIERFAETPHETAEEPAIVLRIGAGRVFVGHLAVQLVPIGTDRDQEDLHYPCSYDSTALLKEADRHCYNPRVVARLFPLLVALALALLPARAQEAASGGTIRTEFRVFDGTTEVTAETRLRIRPSGSEEKGRILEGPQLTAELPAGIYDVQAVRQQAGRVMNVRWAERLVVMAYPDEGGRHLEVINFANEHGALQLRWPEGQAPDPAGVAITVVRAGETRSLPARVLHGLGYALLVLPAGTYDVRIARPGHDTTVLTDIEVPADRTRMKVIE